MKGQQAQQGQMLILQGLMQYWQLPLKSQMEKYLESFHLLIWQGRKEGQMYKRMGSKQG